MIGRALWPAVVLMMLAQAGPVFRTAASTDLARCLNGAADAACVAAASARTIAAAAPAAPTGLSSTVSGSTVTLTWQAPAGAAIDTCVIEAGSTTGSASLANFSMGDSLTTYSASGVGNGTYYVRARAQNAAGTSVVSNEVVVAVGAAAQAFDLREAVLGMDASVGGVSPDVAFAAGWSHLVLVRNRGIGLFRKATGADPIKQLSARISRSSDPPRVPTTSSPIPTSCLIRTTAAISRSSRRCGRRWRCSWRCPSPRNDANFMAYSTLAVDPADGSVWNNGLVPSALPFGASPEVSDVWVGHLRSMDALQ